MNDERSRLVAANYRCWRANGDALWVAPRAHMHAFTERPLAAHASCEPPVLRGGSQSYHAYHHALGDCCGPSAEAMLASAVLTNETVKAATTALPPAEQSALDGVRCGERGVAAGAILRNINSAPVVERESACRATCHRAMRHVCDASLQQAYATSPELRHTYWGQIELHERAGLALRRLFGTNVSECRAALRYFAEDAAAAPATGARRRERCIGSWCSEG